MVDLVKADASLAAENPLCRPVRDAKVNQLPDARLSITQPQQTANVVPQDHF